MGTEFRKCQSTNKKTPSKRDWVTCLPLNRKKNQLQVCSMQFHLFGILFRLTNEYTLFSFCPQMKKKKKPTLTCKGSEQEREAKEWS